MRAQICVLFILAMIVTAKEKAILEIVIYKTTENGEYKMSTIALNGHFSPAGAAISAEGDIVQIHPLGLCNNRDFEELHDPGWVGVVKLEEPYLEPEPCLSIFQKAKRAMQRGATAVVFDISDDPRAAKQLRKSVFPSLKRPVVIIRGKEASKLMEIVNTRKIARARIVHNILETATVQEPKGSNKEKYDMGIFVSVFVLFSIICVIIIVKLKWKQREHQLSVSELAKQAVNKLETRKYTATSGKSEKPEIVPTMDFYSSSSGLEACAICLEDYQEGQELRVLPCTHEFHRVCVDPWLVDHHTCPLCIFNIVEEDYCGSTHLSLPGEAPGGDLLSRLPHSLLQANNNNSDDGRGYPIPYRSAVCGNIHFIHNGEVAHGCPSCSATVGSSPSSCSSYIRDPYHPYAGAATTHSDYPACAISNYSKFGFQNNPCLANKMSHNVTKYRNPTSSSSGLARMHIAVKKSCQRLKYSSTNAGSSRPVTIGKTKLYTPQNLKPGASWDSDPESSESSHQGISISATYGSSSSSGMSNSYLECQCCRLSDTTVIDSNQSTYGSSEQLPSEVSSFNSNIYRGSPEIPADLPCSHAGRVMTGNVEESIAREISSGDSSSSQSSLSKAGQHDVCHCVTCVCSANAHLSLSRLSELSVVNSNESLTIGSSQILQNNDAKRDIKSVHNSLALCQVGTLENVTHPVIQKHCDCSACEHGISHEISHGISHGPDTSQCIMERQDTGRSNCDFSSPHDTCLSIDSGHAAVGKYGHIRHQQPLGKQHQEISQYDSERTDTWTNSQLDESFCGNSTHISMDCTPTYRPIREPSEVDCGIDPSPRQSMVLFTEEQGMVVTISLEDKETYDPMNGV